MQTLGLSDSEPRTEGRLKSLFWPSIQTGTDVDYLGAQGYWVCTVIAVLSFVYSAVSGNPIIGALLLLLFYLGGVGVRERSRYAASVVLALYFVDTLLSGLGVVKIIIGALLISNLRATWIAAHWKPEAEEAAAATGRDVERQVRRPATGMAVAQSADRVLRLLRCLPCVHGRRADGGTAASRALTRPGEGVRIAG
jgi:hypothetical protein